MILLACLGSSFSKQKLVVKYEVEITLVLDQQNKAGDFLYLF